MKQEYDGNCPTCKNCNHEELDHQHGENESILWLRCEDCGCEFRIELEWYVASIDKEGKKQ